MNEKITKLLKEARLRKNMKQIEVAEKLGVKKNTISNWENGKAEPDIDTFVKLCDIYEVVFSDLLEEAYKVERQLTALNFSLQEIDHIKKYRILDERGKRSVNAALEAQYDIVAAKKESSAACPYPYTPQSLVAKESAKYTLEDRAAMHRQLDEQLDAKEKGATSSAS